MTGNAVECAVCEADPCPSRAVTPHNAWSRNSRTRFRALRLHIRLRFRSSSVRLASLAQDDHALACAMPTVDYHRDGVGWIPSKDQPTPWRRINQGCGKARAAWQRERRVAAENNVSRSSDPRVYAAMLARWLHDQAFRCDPTETRAGGRVSLPAESSTIVEFCHEIIPHARWRGKGPVLRRCNEPLARTARARMRDAPGSAAASASCACGFSFTRRCPAP